MTAPPADRPAPARRPIRSFVVRPGRMGPGQARALAELGPRFVLPYRAEPTDFGPAFGRRAPLVLEIGFGMGDATRDDRRRRGRRSTSSASRSTRPASARC